MTEAIWFLSITELAAAYREERLTPVEVAHAYLGRIATLDPLLNTYITVTRDAALEAARDSAQRFTRGTARSPLEGVPLGLKDLIDTKGIRTTAGSALYATRVPERDATVVQRLKAAGAVLLGKHALDEFAWSGPASDGSFPTPRNPWDTSRTAGSSSSGSAAAVVAGLCAGALGTDTGGSIRSPAALCGAVGLKPSFGLVSCAGVIPLSSSFDHCGPLTRTVEDAATILDVIAGYDQADPASIAIRLPSGRDTLFGSVAGVRIGVPIAYIEAQTDLEAETLAAFDTALKVLGSAGGQILALDLGDLDEIRHISRVIMGFEALRFHRRDFQERPGLYGPRLRRFLAGATGITAHDYEYACRAREDLCRAITRTMDAVDVIATPTKLSTAADLMATYGPADHNPRSALFTRLFNLTGQPAITLPCGYSQRGLPIGLQLAGRLFEDRRLLALAHAYEQSAPWSRRHPVFGQGQHAE